MPLLSYSSSNFPFQPNTKIYSADVDQCFTDIQTLLNTTKLDSTNIQTSGVSTANLTAQSVTLAKLDTTTVTPFLLPSGAIVDFAGSSAPTGFLACDGSLVSRTTYSALFAAIGTTWGVGDGSTTFGLPDLRGRTAIGDGTGSGLSARTLGQTLGAESHTHTVNAHNHRVTIANPGSFQTTYDSSGTSVNMGSTTLGLGTGISAVNYDGSGTQLVVGNLYSDNASPATNSQSLMQPTAVVKKIIKI